MENIELKKQFDTLIQESKAEKTFETSLLHGALVVNVKNWLARDVFFGCFYWLNFSPMGKQGFQCKYLSKKATSEKVEKYWSLMLEKMENELAERIQEGQDTRDENADENNPYNEEYLENVARAAGCSVQDIKSTVQKKFDALFDTYKNTPLFEGKMEITEKIYVLSVAVMNEDSLISIINETEVENQNNLEKSAQDLFCPPNQEKSGDSAELDNGNSSNKRP